MMTQELTRNAPGSAGRRVLPGVAAIGLLALTSCADSTGPSADELEAIGDGLLLSVVEIHHPVTSVGDPQQFVTLTSRRTYGSCPQLVGRVFTTGTTIRVHVLGLRHGGPAIIVPAYFAERVSIPDGDYTVEVAFREHEDRYRLLVSPSALLLDQAGAAGFSETAIDVFYRFPERSFSYFCNRGSESFERCDAFERSLRNRLALEPLQFSGGVNPYVYNHDVPETAGDDHRVSFFRYASEEDFTRAKEMLCGFSEESPGVIAGVRSWRNDWIFSWGPSCKALLGR
jgi:hypothetical protein